MYSIQTQDTPRQYCGSRLKEFVHSRVTNLTDLVRRPNGLAPGQGPSYRRSPTDPLSGKSSKTLS